MGLLSCGGVFTFVVVMQGPSPLWKPYITLNPARPRDPLNSALSSLSLPKPSLRFLKKALLQS